MQTVPSVGRIQLRRSMKYQMYKIDEYHRNVVESDLIDDLKRVAFDLKKESVTMDEYNDFGKYHSTTLTRRFGSWFKTLEKAGLKKTRNLHVTDIEYFQNIEEVWSTLGRQPKYADMIKPLSKYCAGAYEKRFGSWIKALEKFIEYINNGDVLDNQTVEILSTKGFKKHKTKRSINWRLRFIIMRRDNFKCKICGKSPATDTTVTLQVDHIIPWDKGGETEESNLQTLCSYCNVGKSNLDLYNE